MTAVMELTVDHGIIKRIPFDTIEEAQAELDKFKGKLGLGYYTRNEKEETTLHEIKGRAGTCTIVLCKISTASVHDVLIVEEMNKEVNDVNNRASVEYLLMCKEAGVQPPK